MHNIDAPDRRAGGRGFVSRTYFLAWLPFVFMFNYCILVFFNIMSWRSDLYNIIISSNINIMLFIKCVIIVSYLQDITGHSLTGVQEKVLNYITYIGCALSMVALVITLTIFLSFRWVKLISQLNIH